MDRGSESNDDGFRTIASRVGNGSIRAGPGAANKGEGERALYAPIGGLYFYVCTSRELYFVQVILRFHPQTAS